MPETTSSSPEIPPNLGQTKSLQGPPSRAPFWYSILFVATQVVLLLLCFSVSPSSWFLAHDDYPMLRQNLGYSLRVPGIGCDIVLYGDSTALTGLDPAVIEARTGLKTCNLSELRSVHWIVSSYFPLDQYLAHNPRPRFIFSEWGAFEFHPEPKSMVDYQGEGFEYAMLYDRGPDFRTGLIRHPIWPVWFSIWVGNRVINDVLSRLSGNHETEWAAEKVPRDARAGLWQYPSPAETHCVEANGAHHPLNREETEAAIAAFKDRYAIGGTHVIVEVSPVADCVVNRKELISDTESLGDNRLGFLPVHLFNNHDVHFTPEGSGILSGQAADQILSIMHQDAMAKADGASSPAKGTSAQ